MRHVYFIVFTFFWLASGLSYAQTVNTFPYSEDFESGTGNWVSGGANSSWALGTPSATVINTAAPGGSNSWATNLSGTFNTSEASFVESPVLDMTNMMGPALNLDVWWDSELNWSMAQLQTSIDGGATWSTLGTASTGTNWYTTGGPANGAGSAFFISTGSNDFNWSGEDVNNAGSGGWVTAAHALTGLGGQSNAKIRVVFGCDAVNGTDGFAFDNVFIGEGDDIGVDSILLTGQSCEGITLPIELKVCNTGLVEQSNYDLNINVNGTSYLLNIATALPSGSCDTIVFNGANAIAGVNTINAWTSLPTDADLSNDTAATILATSLMPPTVDLGADTSFCAGGTVTLDAGPGNTYNWSSGATTQTFTTNIGGTFTVAVTNANNCTVLDTVNIIQHVLPIIDLGNDTAICLGETVTLNPGAGFSGYAWSDGSGGPTLDATAANTYTVTVTDTNGCMGSDMLTLTVNSPDFSLGPDTMICEGGEIVLLANLPGIVSATWSDGNNPPVTSPIFVVTDLGTYTVTVTDLDGCMGSDTIEVIGTFPAANIDLGPDLFREVGKTVTFDAGAGFVDYNWSTGATTQTISVLNQGIYRVTVTDDNGCNDADTAALNLFPVGLDDPLTESSFKLFPNPTEGLITIQLQNNSNSIPVRLEVFNLQGSMVYRENIAKFDQGQQQLDISSLPKGVYLIHLTSNDQTWVKEIIKQ